MNKSTILIICILIHQIYAGSPLYSSETTATPPETTTIPICLPCGFVLQYAVPPSPVR